MDISVVECGVATDQNSVLLMIPDRPQTPQAAAALASGLSPNFKVHVVNSALPPGDEVPAYVEHLIAALEARKIKRVTVFGVGAGGSIAQALAVFAPKVIRRVLLLDATTRLQPGLLLRVIDRVEAYLPLGLPLRSLSNDFDSRPLLHRVHCPTLIIAQNSASAFVKDQANLLARRIPNSWLVSVAQAYTENSSGLSTEVVTLVEEFLQVPVKRPQKGTQKALAKDVPENDGTNKNAADKNTAAA